MVFCEVVCKVFGSFSPVDKELSLFDAISDPVKTHVHGLGATLFDRFVADAGGACIIGLDWCGWLGMAHVFQGGAQHGRFLAVVEQGGEFSFGGGREDWDKDGGVDVDGPIGWRRRRVRRRGLERVGEGVA